MNKTFDLAAWRASIDGWWERALVAVVDFIPSLLLALLILGAGWVLARLMQALARWTLRRAGVDRAGGSERVAEALRHSRLSASISQLIARLLFWALFLTSALFALRTLGVLVVADTLARVFGFLPNLFAVVVIVAVGIPVARLTRSLVVSAAATAKLPQAPRLGTAAGLLVSLLILVLALGQLGIETDLLVTLSTAFVATVGLSMGLAFALGARPLVTKILAGHFLRQSLPLGSLVQLGETGGEVEQVGPISTQLRRGEEVLVVPNDLMANQVIKL